MEIVFASELDDPRTEPPRYGLFLRVFQLVLTSCLVEEVEVEETEASNAEDETGTITIAMDKTVEEIVDGVAAEDGAAEVVEVVVEEAVTIGISEAATGEKIADDNLRMSSEEVLVAEGLKTVITAITTVAVVDMVDLLDQSHPWVDLVALLAMVVRLRRRQRSRSHPQLLR